MMKGTHNDNPADYYIVLWPSKEYGFSWFICCTPRGVPLGGDKDVDFYNVPETENLAIFPPTKGWRVKIEGRHPPPTLSYDSLYHLARVVARNVGNKAPRLSAPCLSSLLKEKRFDQAIREAAVYWSIAQTIYRRSDREHLCTAIIHFLFAEYDHVQQARIRVHHAINVGSRQEQCYLLELAVWKSMCIMHIPGNLSDAFAWSDWHRAGWKIRKSEVRNSNSINVVVTAVIPFLDALADGMDDLESLDVVPKPVLVQE
jgi:hypothetical protein